MIPCLNSLEKDIVFIPIAALLALVLLVWVQLHVRGGREERNVNWYCGVAWAYLAILFALFAVALFVLDNASACAKGFLILAFFMTGMNIFVLFVLNIFQLRIFSGGECPENPPVTSFVGGCSCRKSFSLIWLATLAGLILISFSLVGVCCRCCLCVGIALVAAAVLTVVVIVCCRVWRECIWPKCCRLCTWIRNHWCKRKNDC